MTRINYRDRSPMRVHDAVSVAIDKSLHTPQICRVSGLLRMSRDGQPDSATAVVRRARYLRGVVLRSQPSCGVAEWVKHIHPAVLANRYSPVRSHLKDRQ